MTASKELWMRPPHIALVLPPSSAVPDVFPEAWPHAVAYAEVFRRNSSPEFRAACRESEFRVPGRSVPERRTVWHHAVPA